MEWLYPTRFTDRWGSEATTMLNDGANLAVTLRGVQFSGPDFDTLEADPRTPKESLAKFTVSSFGCLCSCVFDVDIETPVLVRDEEQTGVLAVHLELGEPTRPGVLDASAFAEGELQRVFVRGDRRFF